jgi:iron complex transport system substrate-binding protein
MTVQCETMGSRVIQSIARALLWCAIPLLLIVGGCTSEAPRPAAAPTDAELRTVSMVPSLADIAIAIGAAEHLVARTDYDTHPALLDRPSIGGGLDPNLETLVGLGAKVVLLAAGRDTPALQERLAAVGIEGVPFQTQSIADIYTSIATLGAMFGRESAADSLRDYIVDELEAVRVRVAGRQPVSVLYVVWPDPPMTVGPGAFVDEVISMAGGRNVFEDSAIEWPTVGFESIVDRAPDVVLWPQGEITVGNVDRLRSTPGWRDVGAVQEGRVELVDANLFNRPGPNVVEAARVLARLLHPDAR